MVSELNKRLRMSLFFGLVSFLAIFTSSQSASAKDKKSHFNSNVYEQESSEESFSARVKIIRDLGETEVLFENAKNGGPYTLRSNSPNFGLYKTRLEKSRKSGLPVKVTIDNDTIKSVEIEEAKERTPANEKDILNSILKK